MIIIGISAFYHDSAVAIVRDGKIIAASQEERFTRKKHDSSFPTNALQSCLEIADIDISEIDVVVFYEKPLLKFERLLETYITYAPRGFNSFRSAIPLWLRDKLFLKKLLVKELKNIDQQISWDDKILFSEHHLSHAASAFYPSPFEEAAVLTLDGVGEWATTTLSIGSGKSLDIIKEIKFPHSLGLLYSAFTFFLGFRVNSGEYKVMGLAPYGEPIYKEIIFENILDLKSDGSFWLDQRYFNYSTGTTMTSKKFHDLFGMKPRKPEDPLNQIHFDIAASIQAVLNEAVLRLTRFVQLETGMTNLCLAGGVALNCVTNGEILRDGVFNNIWIQPAAGDAGGALGAALAVHHLHHNESRTIVNNSDQMQGTYLGPEYSQSQIEKDLHRLGANFKVLKRPELLSLCAKSLISGKALGWFQGKMEFGPRALGARSILANPTLMDTQTSLNLKVKFRESFRPFAPAILSEHLSDWFDMDSPSPYMLFVGNVQSNHCYPSIEDDEKLQGIDKLRLKRSSIPAVTHIDYSARVQTVHHETNPLFHELISKFYKETGVPILVNTSFNVRGEPIVGTPEDAYRCFMGTNIEVLAIGNCILFKEDQPVYQIKSYIDKFELD